MDGNWLVRRCWQISVSLRVGGHLEEIVGFGGPSPGRPRPRTADARRAQVATDRHSMNARGVGDPTQRPTQTAERQNLVLFGMLQDVAHPGEGLHTSLAYVNVSAVGS